MILNVIAFHLLQAVMGFYPRRHGFLIVGFFQIQILPLKLLVIDKYILDIVILFHSLYLDIVW